jgi:hypothetical protein
MALRSALPFHNQWPNTTSYAALPNVSAPDTTALEEGDICYDSVNDVYYYCTVPTPGAAVWLTFGGFGPATDRQEPYLIVGNALAGDTSLVCDILDPGDGTGIQTALSAAGYDPLLNISRDVYVRPGEYFISGNSPITLNIPDGAKLRGAGRGRTIIYTPQANTAFTMTTFGCELQDLTIKATGPASGPGADGYIQVASGSQPIFGMPFAIRRVDIEIEDGYDPTNAIVNGIAINVTPPFSTFGNVIEDVRTGFTGVSFVPRAAAGFGNRTTGVRAFIQGHTSIDPRLYIDLRNVIVSRLEMGFETDGPEFIMSDCIYDGSGFNSFPTQPTLQIGFRIRATSRHSKLDDCTSTTSITSGIAQGFSFSRLLADANFIPTYIALNNCTANGGQSSGIAGGYVAAGSAGAPIQNLRLYGCRAELMNVGFFFSTDTEYAVGIANSAVTCATPLLDTGTANDFGHLQTY